MRARCLDFIRCPECLGGLKLEGDWHDGYVETGKLACVSCGKLYPIEDGIARLLPDKQIGKFADKTRDAFSHEWLNYPGSYPEDEKIFIEETQLDKPVWQGKTVLDAGCGMGRFTKIALSCGAEVVAIDFSESERRLANLARENPKLHVVQGNLLKPPLKDGVFDIAYSIGVLHHTASARDAFCNVAKTVKSGGYFTMWLYGRAGKWSEFKTNPLRADRQNLEKIKFFVWLTVATRLFMSDFLRFFTTRLPVKAVHWLCYPVTLLGAIPGIKYLTFSVLPDFKARFFENFDWLSPPYQSHHTKEEAIVWNKECGFEPIKILPHGFVPKAGILGRKL